VHQAYSARWIFGEVSRLSFEICSKMLALTCFAALALIGLSRTERIEHYGNESVANPWQLFGPIRCDACKFLIKLVQDVEEGNVTLDAGKGIAKTYCELNGGGLGYTCTGSWQCKDVCGGAVDEFAPIVLEVFILDVWCFIAIRFVSSSYTC
jgi:hypothetical protein